MEEKKIERIDAYLLNRMTDKERKQFEEDLKTDDALRKQYHFMKTMKTSLASWNDMKQTMQAWDEKARKQVASDQQRHKTRRLWIGGAVAAAVVAIAIVLPMAVPSTNESPMSFAAQETGRGDDETFGDAAPNVEQSMISENVDYKYITAACAPAQVKEIKESINLEDYDAAISELDEAIRTAKTQAGRDSLTWVKAELLIKIDKEQEARVILENLKQTSEIFRFKADSLLRVINQ